MTVETRRCLIASCRAGNVIASRISVRAIPLPDCSLDRSLASPTAFSADFAAVPHVLPIASFWGTATALKMQEVPDFIGRSGEI